MEGFWKYFTALFLIGLINNFSYVLISAGSQAIADHFGETDLMPLFQLMLISFSIPILVINFRYLATVNTLFRITLVCASMAISFIVLAVCVSSNSSWSFPISLIATLVMGMAQTLGECVNLGFIKELPSEYIIGFTSGTGFAGIAGSGVWLVCNAIGLSNTYVFLIFMPLLLVYWLSFLWIYRKVKTTNKDMALADIISTDTSQKPNSNNLISPIEESKPEGVSKTGNAFFSIHLIKTVWKNVWFWSINLFFVYFLEYTIIVGLADRATLKYKDEKSFVKENSYEIIQFCYQFGVWCSRSSIKLFKVKLLWVITVIQLGNFCLWWLEAEFLFLSVWGEFGLTVWVGCMGGLAYANIGYLILNSDIIPKGHKEAGMNVSLCLNDLGVFFSSCFCLILDNYIMKN